MRTKKDIDFYDKFMSFIGGKEITQEMSFVMGLYFLRDNSFVDKNYLEFLYNNVPASKVVDIELVCYHTFGKNIKDFIKG